jgi:hypothetical protein
LTHREKNSLFRPGWSLHSIGRTYTTRGRRLDLSLHGRPLVAKPLEHIGDHAGRIAGSFAVIVGGRTWNSRLARELDQAGGSAIAILDKVFRTLVGGDIDGAKGARAQQQDLIDALARRVATMKGEELRDLGIAVDGPGRVASYATDISEPAFNLAVPREPATSEVAHAGSDAPSNRPERPWWSTEVSGSRSRGSTPRPPTACVEGPVR